MGRADSEQTVDFCASGWLSRQETESLGRLPTAAVGLSPIPALSSRNACRGRLKVN